MKRHGQSALRAVLFLGGCALLAYLFLRLHPAEVWALLVRIGWHFGLIVAVYCGYDLLRAAALGACVAGKRPPFGRVLQIRLYGEALQFLTFTGPFLAQPGMAWFLRARGLSSAQAAAAAISEFLVYTLTSAAMSVAGLAYLLHAYHLSLAVAVAARAILYGAVVFLLVSAYALIRRIFLIGAIVGSVSRLPLIHVNAAEVRNMEESVFEVLRDRPRRFLEILILETAAQALLVVELFVILHAIGWPFSPLDPLLIESSTKFISVGFFFVPMQVGVAEGVYAVIFQALGISAPAGIAVALARRLRSLLAAGVGLAWGFLSRRAH